MKIKELRAKNTKDLLDLTEEKRKDLRDFVFGNAGSKSKNTKLGKSLKKDIARILTVLNESKKNK